MDLEDFKFINFDSNLENETYKELDQAIPENCFEKWTNDIVQFNQENKKKEYNEFIRFF